MNSTMQRERMENCAAMSQAFDAIDAAVDQGLISTITWMQCHEDIYNNPKAAAFFLQGASKWSPAEQGRCLVNYLKQYHPQEA